MVTISNNTVSLVLIEAKGLDNPTSTKHSFFRKPNGNLQAAAFLAHQHIAG